MKTLDTMLTNISINCASLRATKLASLSLLLWSKQGILLTITGTAQIRIPNNSKCFLMDYANTCESDLVQFWYNIKILLQIIGIL